MNTHGAQLSNGITDCYHTALYARLSILDSGKADGESMNTQIALLERFVAESPSLRRVELFVDNGYTGTNFQRPEWERMMLAVRQKKINCIVVKDLSRLGRNYIEAGEILEKVCPFLGVRFIAINDGYDSAALTSTDELTASLKNIVNDYYAKDISLKSGSSLKSKRLRGDYVGSYAPHGYQKDPDNKNRLMIDPVTAPIIRRIFSLFAEGHGYTALTRMLNAEGEPSPGRYRFEHGIVTNNNKKGANLLWNRHVLKDILQNITYIGHLAQGKCSTSLHLGIPTHRVAEGQWDVVHHTHEPIIEEALFWQVQEQIKERTAHYKANWGKYPHLPGNETIYGRKLVCADCGMTMRRYRNIASNGKKAWFTYHCRTHDDHGDMGCSRKRLREAELNEAVLATIKTQIALFLNTRQALEAASEMRQTALTQPSPKTAQRKNVDAQLQRKRALTTSVYTDYKAGILTLEEYRFAKQKFTGEVENLERELSTLQGSRPALDMALSQSDRWTSILKAYQNVDAVSRALVEILVEKISVSDCSQIAITLRFHNEMQRLLVASRSGSEEVA